MKLGINFHHKSELFAEEVYKIRCQRSRSRQSRML